MNLSLRYEIVKHIFCCFSIIESDFVFSESFAKKEFLLKKISFEDDEKKYNVFGIEMPIIDNKAKFILADLTSDDPEYYLTIALENSPVYGLYISKHDAFLACSVNENWMECNTYIQSTFLMAMEQIRDFGFSYSKLSSDDSYNKLLSFISFHDECLENNEKI